MFKKDYTKQYTGHLAHTLEPKEVTNQNNAVGLHTRTHKSGWTICGEVKEDYFYWVNDFTAEHPQWGKLSGNFEHEVIAESEEAFNHFINHHKPVEWDYWDI
jgi:hypothetical protein